MSKIVSNLTDLIGNTPLLQLKRLEKELNIQSTILAKLESFNPGGSVKDRIAFAMIEDAEKRGVLKQGSTIIEPTSGNTGIGLAWVSSVKGYNLILTMPESMSLERRNLLKALGAQLVLTPASEGMKGAIAKAEELKSQTPNSIILGQFDNPANYRVHQETTGEEIWRDTDGDVDLFVAGVGTSGTISGVGLALKAHNPNVKLVAVEPASSPVLSGGAPGPHKIQGIGAGFIPKIYQDQVVDEVVTIENDEAIQASRLLAKHEGLLVGISSGAAISAALKLSQRAENVGKKIVVLLPDTGERYLTTGLYASDSY